MDTAAVRGSVAVASPCSRPGAGVRGYPSWRIDSAEDTKAQRYEAGPRSSLLIAIEVLLSTKGALQVQWQICGGGDESSDEELDPELYGPPGDLGF